MKRKNVSDNLFFSEIFGGGIYQWNSQFVCSPLDRRGEENSPLLIHAVTGEQYYTKWVDTSEGMRSYYQKLILSPPQCSNILWPSDMISVPEARAGLFGLPVAQNYFEVKPVKRPGETAVLLFSYTGGLNAVGAAERLDRTSPHGWRDPVLQKIAGHTVEIFHWLNRAGYAYQDFHLSRFFFGNDGRVILDFTNLIFPLKKGSRGPSDRMRISSGKFPLEFAEPAFVYGRKKRLDIRSQNYSLCALLFFLFLGRYAYDGRLMDENPDKTVREDRKMPAFIFDPEDLSNRVGEFEEEQLVIERWGGLPEVLKEAFLMTLRQNGEKDSPCVCYPTPATWLWLLEQLGWYP